MGGLDIARLATGFYGFTAWTIVLSSGFYWGLHFFFSFPPLKLPEAFYLFIISVNKTL